MDRATPQTEPRILVWDLPTRLFHALLAAALVTAFAIATLVDDESRWYPAHMLLGAVAALMVLLRLVWGVVGTRWARLSSFAFGPRAVIGYLRGAFGGGDKPHTGHNPGSAVAIWAMFALVLGLAATGVLMSSGGEAVEELHEVLAYSLAGVVVAHLAGVAWHTLRRRENIALGMVDGRKVGPASDAIATAQPLAALVFVGLVGGAAVALVRGYDPATRTASVLGATVVLGEGEGREGERGVGEGEGEGERERGRGEHGRGRDHDD